MRTPPTPTKPEEVRLTIPVTAEVHEAFTRIAKATRMPVGRAMGEWLGDTLDAAQFMAQTLEKARAAPRLVAQEMHAYALGLGDETGELLKRMREKGRGRVGDEGSALAPARPRTTPPSNTGVTTVKNKNRKGGTDAV
jgi:NTP pyrophosphatase (non-canonical NTP hydrolase)